MKEQYYLHWVKKGVEYLIGEKIAEKEDRTNVRLFKNLGKG